MTRRILIVDDDALILRGVGRVLRRDGWEVVACRHAPEALRALQAQVFDAVLVDYDLGDHTGLDVLVWVQEHAGATIGLLMTGHDDLPAIVDAVNVGAMRVLRKPFQPRELLATLAGAIRGFERRAQATTTSVRERDLAERRALSEVLGNRSIDLALQVIVRASDRSPAGWEALMRPDHPRYPTPTSLLTAAEQHGGVDALGALVLSKAHDRLSALPEDTRLFVNLHPQQLGDPDALEAAIVPLLGEADRLVFEITERSRLQDIERWEESIAVLRAGGFAVAVDDLGAGYSALAMLADVQPQYIKLDMSLVRGITTTPSKQRLVQLLATFGRATGAVVIAEGVENEAQARCLIDCEVELLQGYLFGRPELDPEIPSEE